MGLEEMIPCLAVGEVVRGVRGESMLKNRKTQTIMVYDQTNREGCKKPILISKLSVPVLTVIFLSIISWINCFKYFKPKCCYLYKFWNSTCLMGKMLSSIQLPSSCFLAAFCRNLLHGKWPGSEKNTGISDKTDYRYPYRYRTGTM